MREHRGLLKDHQNHLRAALDKLEKAKKDSQNVEKQLNDVEEVVKEHEAV